MHYTILLAFILEVHTTVCLESNGMVMLEPSWVNSYVYLSVILL